METTELEKLIRQSLIELAKIANEEEKDKSKGQTSKLIFPKYLNGKHKKKKRVSEQETRLLFIRELEKKEGFYYSIETPTTKLYNFSNDKKAPKIVSNKESQLKGQSASFDLTIHNEKFKRTHFIEFKNENVGTIKKDFLKLLCDKNNKVNYLIHTIKREDKGTIPSICKKYAEAVNYIFEKIDEKEHTNSTLKIFLFNTSKEQYRQFEDVKIQKITEDEIKYETHYLKK